MNQFINLAHLKFFCDTVLYESIAEAAKMNFVSQSAISQAISKLESIFGAELLTYSRQKLHLTDEGKVIFERARLIFKTVHETFEEVHKSRETVSGALRFVSTTSLCMSFIAPSYKKIRHAFPKLDFQFKTGNLNLIRTALKREDAEFALVIYGDMFDQFDKYPLKKGHMRLYQAKGSSPNLIEEGVLVDDTEGFFVKELREFFDDAQSTITIQQPIGNWEVTTWFTNLGIGVGFFPDYILANNRYPTIEAHPLEIPLFEYEICAIYNKGAKLSRLAKTFLDQLTF